MTVRELIAGAGIGANTYFTKLRGERPFNTNEVDHLARALGMTPEIILTRAAKPAADTSPAAPTVTDAMDIAQIEHETRSAYDLAAERSRRKSDEPHAD